ncbi:MAG TPA: redoxin domain-containing protein [Chitinophagaceae bacterium]|nr:redoxin domain-containing protein [Chitinophagaceae bacterium]
MNNEDLPMRTNAMLILFLFIALPGLHAQPLNDSVFAAAKLQQPRLQDAASGKLRKLTPLAAPQLMQLYIFLSPECPLCQNYAQVLNKLHQQYGNAVQFYGIVPGKTYSAATVTAFARKYVIRFPLLIDQAKQLTNYLQASITPEVILLNSRYELVYKGAIDNRMKSLGVQRWKATENYLQDAISQYLQPAAVAVKRTRATGCLINDF